MGDLNIKRSLPVISVLLAILVLFSGGCSGDNSNDAGALEYVPNPLDFYVGEYSSIQLEADGGKPPYQWGIKAGIFLPSGFSLSARGILSGKAPTLESGVTEQNTEPFTIIIKDSAGGQIEVDIIITYIKR